MEVATGVVGLIQGAEMVLKLGKRVIGIIQTYKHASESLRQHVLRVEGIWLRTETQIVAIRKMSTSNRRLQDFQLECFEILEGKLQMVLAKLGGYTDTDLSAGVDVQAKYKDLNFIRRTKYALLEKRLKTLVGDLQSWHATFDPSWYLITRLAGSEIDVALEETEKEQPGESILNLVQQIRSVIRDSKLSKAGVELPLLEEEPVSLGNLTAEQEGLNVATYSHDKITVVVDSTKYHKHTNPRTVLETVFQIVQLLSISDPFSLGFLKCVGVRKDDQNQYDYVLELPPGSGSPKLLRNLLSRPSPSLNTKVHIARSLARSVLALHAADFVHKNIRPETIIILSNDADELDSPYLVGFEQIRSKDGYSAMFGDMVFERNLYRHPSRQGIRPQEQYIMQHDVYSLGVCLYEIGMWTSLVEPADAASSGSSLDFGPERRLRNQTQAAFRIKQKLIDSANSSLPGRMGTTYTQVVVSCLSCLDNDSADPFEIDNEKDDESGILVGIAFIKQILTRLEAISL